jgi:hypothetical protein
MQGRNFVMFEDVVESLFSNEGVERFGGVKKALLFLEGGQTSRGRI